MKFHAKFYLGVLSALILTMPAWASKNSFHKDSTGYDVTRTTMIGTTQLQPGHYTIKATETEKQFEVLQDGKVIATVPCEWMTLPKKAEQSSIATNANRVSEVEFGGRKEALKVG